MNTGQTVFSQVMDLLPHWDFRKCVKRYHGDRKIQQFSCMDQFLSMAFAQLTYRESLRDIEVCLRGNQSKLYHMGIRSHISRSTLADANEKRDWRIYADFAQILISMAKDLYARDDFFVTRSKRRFQFQRRYSRPVDKAAGVRCDQTIILTGVDTARDYPQPLRRIKYYDSETQKSLIFLTNHFTLPALTIAKLYRARWQVELFFKWIKQHLRIKAFYGTSANAVKTQIWIAVSVYVLVAILKKRLDLEQSLYTILQFLSVSIFEKTPISETFSQEFDKSRIGAFDNQLLLFEL